MIQVRVRLFANLRNYHPELRFNEPKVVHLPDGATVKLLVAALGIPEGIVRKVFRQGRAIEDDCMLSDGDDLGMFPPVAGGSIGNRANV